MNKVPSRHTLRIAIGITMLVLMLAVFGIVQAEIETPNMHLGTRFLYEPQMPGKLVANGTHFELNNSNYLNITLESTEPIELVLESAYKMVTMVFNSTSGAKSTYIKLSGLAPRTAYNKYEDNYHDQVAFITDINGNYTYEQDLSKPYFVFIQPEDSTKFTNSMIRVSRSSFISISSLPGIIFINDNATGGDCILIGTWDAGTKTCMMTTDLTSTIQIDSNGITLDGNGHTLIGNGAGYGVYFQRRNPHMQFTTIRNLVVTGYSIGIFLSEGESNNFIDNAMTSNGVGFQCGSEYSWGGCRSNILVNNTANSNGYGIVLSVFTGSNKLINNTVNYNSNTGIFLDYDGGGHTLANNTVNFNGKGIDIYDNHNLILIDNTANFNGIGIITATGSWNKLVNNTANFNSNIGICVDDAYSTNDNMIKGNKANSNANIGISILWGGDRIFVDNTANSNNVGIQIRGTNHDILTNNTATFNDVGISIENSYTITLNGNRADSNNIGIKLFQTEYNKLNSNKVVSNNIGISTDNYVSCIPPMCSSGTGKTNEIYDNYFNNSNNFYSTDFYSIDSSILNLSKTSGLNIAGGPYLGGNFWAYPNGTGFSQTCADANKDGICDSTYPLDANNTDYLPLALYSLPPGYGYISGTVLNGTGIPGAIVTTNASNITTTDASGIYFFLVPAGTYNLSVTREPEYYSNRSVVVSAISGTTVSQDIDLLKKSTGTITGRVITRIPYP